MREGEINYYDSLLYDEMVEEYYGHSGFANYGYWDENTTDAKEACCNLMEKLLAFVPVKSGRILDVACGKGGTTSYLLNYYPAANVTAINISEKQLKTARHNAPGCTFLVADAANPQIDDISFDNIICVESAFHFYTREKFLHEALRLLKPGGHLVLSDILLKEGAEKRMESLHEENYLPNPEEYREFCQRVGFSEVTVVDATKPCWERHFWNVIRFVHGKYLRREIKLDTFKASLKNTYKIASALKWYLLVSLRKG